PTSCTRSRSQHHCIARDIQCGLVPLGVLRVHLDGRRDGGARRGVARLDAEDQLRRGTDRDVERGARGRRHAGGGGGERVPRPYLVDAEVREGRDATYGRHAGGDRKSTRLNSSHQIISYAVFCLKKKTEQRINRRSTPQSGVE